MAGHHRREASEAQAARRDPLDFRGRPGARYPHAMRASRALVLALALALPAVASLSVVAVAAAADGDKAEKGKDKGSAATTNKFVDLVRQGNEKYEAKDASAAIEIYKKAI